jgi:[ribosomal protein S18]-alanine N-acetyltransferase
VPATAALKRATLDDLDRLAALERICFDRPWSPALLQEELDQPCSRIWIALEGSRATAYAIVRVLPGAGELLRIGVVPERRRHGLGGALLAAAASEVRRSGGDELQLEARADNREANALYRRHGFRESGRRGRYYEDGGDAILWTLDLVAEPSR